MHAHAAHIVLPIVIVVALGVLVLVYEGAAIETLSSVRPSGKAQFLRRHNVNYQTKISLEQ